MPLMTREVMIDGAAAPVVGQAFNCRQPEKSIQLTIEGAGAVYGTALIEVSNDGKVWFPEATMTVGPADSPNSTIELLKNPLGIIRASITDIGGSMARAFVTIAH